LIELAQEKSLVLLARLKKLVLQSLSSLIATQRRKAAKQSKQRRK
jgi:hypothetical protein